MANTVNFTTPQQVGGQTAGVAALDQALGTGLMMDL